MCFLPMRGPAGIPAELERRFKQTDAILRFITIKKDPRDSAKGQKKVKQPRRSRQPRLEPSLRP